MPAELTALTLAALLQVVQFAAYSIVANRQVGLRVSTGPRDHEVRLTGAAGRLQRAFANHFEGLALFAIACTVITLTEQSTGLTRACGWAYLAARMVYVPAYVLGWQPARSLIWMAGMAATTLMLLAALV